MKEIAKSLTLIILVLYKFLMLAKVQIVNFCNDLPSPMTKIMFFGVLYICKQ